MLKNGRAQARSRQRGFSVMMIHMLRPQCHQQMLELLCNLAVKGVKIMDKLVPHPNSLCESFAWTGITQTFWTMDITVLDYIYILMERSLWAQKVLPLGCTKGIHRYLWCPEHPSLMSGALAPFLFPSGASARVIYYPHVHIYSHTVGHPLSGAQRSAVLYHESYTFYDSTSHLF